MKLFISIAIFSKLLFVLVTIFRAARSGGDEDMTSRVVGGREAKKFEAPYIVSVHGDWGEGRGEEQFCGGSIYNKKWIITAAHCFKDSEDLKKLKIVAGTLDHTKRAGAQVINVKKRIDHPKFDKYIYSFDVTVMELEKELQFNPSVQPIALPPQGFQASGAAQLSGWGVTKGKKVHDEREGPSSNKLMTLPLVIIPRTECDKYFKKIPKKDVDLKAPTSKVIGIPPPSETIMCAGKLPVVAGKDSCQGDSGGPLKCTRKIDNKWKPYLCGIVSSGYGCALALPGSYTEVAKFTDWIVKNTK